MQEKNVSNNTPAKINPASLAENLQARIRTDLVDLIDPESWKKLLEQEIKKFITQTEVKDYHRTKVVPSGLSVICQELLAQMAKEEIKKLLNPNGVWNEHGDTLSDTVKTSLEQFIKDNWSQMLQTGLAKALAGVLSTLELNLQVSNMYTGS